jgi:Uma2 family endonuclease
MADTDIITDEELLKLPKDGYKRELVDGKIVVSPAGYRHGLVIIRLATRLAAFADQHHLGDVLDSSTDDSPRLVLDKVGEYLGAGARLVWVVDPEARRAAVHRSLTDVTQVGPDGVLDGEDVLPGFTCPLAEIL